jgi:hypothetical protein
LVYSSKNSNCIEGNSGNYGKAEILRVQAEESNEDWTEKEYNTIIEQAKKNRIGFGLKESFV